MDSEDRREFTKPAVATEPKAIFETKDYRIDIVTVNIPDILYPGMAQKYAIMHKRDRVVAGLAEQLPGAIEAARGLQEMLDNVLEGNHIGGVSLPGEKLPRPPGGGRGGPPPQLS